MSEQPPFPLHPKRSWTLPAFHPAHFPPSPYASRSWDWTICATRWQSVHSDRWGSRWQLPTIAAILPAHRLETQASCWHCIRAYRPDRGKSPCTGLQTQNRKIPRTTPASTNSRWTTSTNAPHAPASASIPPQPGTRESGKTIRRNNHLSDSWPTAHRGYRRSSSPHYWWKSAPAHCLRQWCSGLPLPWKRTTKRRATNKPKGLPVPSR